MDTTDSIEAQLEALITERVEAMARQVDWLQHMEGGMSDLKARRDEFWQRFMDHHDDTRKFAHALLHHRVEPVALIAQEPTTAIKPPEPNPEAHAGLRRVAAMLAPPMINGRPNQLARRVAQR